MVNIWYSSHVFVPLKDYQRYMLKYLIYNTKLHTQLGHRPGGERGRPQRTWEYQMFSKRIKCDLSWKDEWDSNRKKKKGGGVGTRKMEKNMLITPQNDQL